MSLTVHTVSLPGFKSVIPSQKLILVGVANVLAIAPTSLLVKMSRGSKSLEWSTCHLVFFT